MSDYEEIPIDDSKGPEQFKVGDWVRVYGWSNIYKVFILKINGECIIFYFEDNYRKSVNWRQCRLLKKKEPREFWWCPMCAESFSSRKHSYGDRCDKDDLIKMREVLNGSS